MFVSALAYYMLSILFSFLVKLVYFDGYLVVREFQLWRLVIPYFTAGMMPMSVLNILISFLWMLSILPPLVIFILMLGKEVINFIHPHRDISSKFNDQLSIDRHLCHRILHILNRSTRASNIELWTVSNVYNIRVVASSTKS